MGIIRRDTDYALRSIIYLALAKGAPTSCAVLAEACDIPKSFAYKILKRLANAGFVISHTGRSGGFRLRRKLKRISLGKIVEVLQGPLSVSECVLNEDACARRDECPVLIEWDKLQKSIVGFLSSTTLDDVLTSLKPARKRAEKKKARV